MSELSEEGGALHTTEALLPEQLTLRLDGAAVLLPPTSDRRVLRLAVQAVHCYPSNGEQTKMTRLLMNALVANAQDLYERLSDTDKELIRRLKGTPRFTASIKRLNALMGRPNSSNYDAVYAAMDAIFKWEMRWDVMGDGAIGAVGTVSEDVITSKEVARFISQWGRGEGPMAGTISYYFPHDVMLMLMEPSRWAQIDLHTANGFGSSYAVELYHHCVRYINTERKITPVLPLAEWIQLIAGAGKYEGRYKDFKRYALQPACEWLEKTESCPFTVEIREVVGPRKRVVGLQFKLVMKVQSTLDMRMPPTWSPNLFEVLRKVYSMTNQDIKELALSASEAEVSEAISRDGLMIQKKLAQGETVANRAAYLRGILRNVQAGRPKDSEPKDDQDVETPPKSVQSAMAKLQALQSEFEAYRLRRLGEMLTGLPGDVLAELREEFRAAKGQEATVAKMLSRGWETPKPGLLATFAAWFKSTYPERASAMLVDPDVSDFNIWLLVNAEEKAAGG